MSFVQGSPVIIVFRRINGGRYILQFRQPQGGGDSFWGDLEVFAIPPGSGVIERVVKLSFDKTSVRDFCGVVAFKWLAANTFSTLLSSTSATSNCSTISRTGTSGGGRFSVSSSDSSLIPEYMDVLKLAVNGA